MFRRLLLSCIVMTAMGGEAWADGPIAVSPGAEARFAGVSSACPTFSWTVVPDAAGYELVV